MRHPKRSDQEIFLFFSAQVQVGMGTAPSSSSESVRAKFREKQQCYNHAESSLSLGSIRMCVSSAFQIFDPSTRLSALFFLLFSTSSFLLPDKQWSSQRLPEVLVVRQGQSYPSSPAEWATYHHHSIIIKGINSKSPRFCLLARAKCTV